MIFPIFEIFLRFFPTICSSLDLPPPHKKNPRFPTVPPLSYYWIFFLWIKIKILALSRIYAALGSKAWFTPYAHNQTPASAQILLNAFLTKHSHRVGTGHAHVQIKRYFARRNERQRERTIWITFSSQSRSNLAEGACFLLITYIMKKCIETIDADEVSNAHCYYVRICLNRNKNK